MCYSVFRAMWKEKRVNYRSNDGLKSRTIRWKKTIFVPIWRSWVSIFCIFCIYVTMLKCVFVSSKNEEKNPMLVRVRVCCFSWLYFLLSSSNHPNPLRSLSTLVIHRDEKKTYLSRTRKSSRLARKKKKRTYNEEKRCCSTNLSNGNWEKEISKFNGWIGRRNWDKQLSTTIVSNRE